MAVDGVHCESRPCGEMAVLYGFYPCRFAGAEAACMEVLNEFSGVARVWGSNVGGVGGSMFWQV